MPYSKPCSNQLRSVCLVAVVIVGAGGILGGCVSTTPGAASTGTESVGAVVADDQPGNDPTGQTPEEGGVDQSELEGDASQPDVGVPAVPAPRGGAPTVWMAASRKMILFGGMSPITNDTFEFDPSDGVWRELAPEQAGLLPDRRCHHTFVVLPDQDAGLLFGGFSLEGRFNDTWRFDADEQSWTHMQTSGDTPIARCLHAAAVIESTNQMLVYGGIHGGGTRASDFFDDTHVLDLATMRWTLLDATGPGKLEGPVTFYVAAEDAVYLWGGKQVDHYATELWRFDVSAQEWSQVVTSGDTPIGREDPTWFWDEARGLLTMFAGRNDVTPEILVDDAWVLDLSVAQWTALSIETMPATRWRASVIFDPQADRGLMFGGWRDFGGAEAFNDTWTYDPSQTLWIALDDGAKGISSK